MSGRRIEHGGRVDRSRAIRFSFDGKGYSGFAGDTLASALLANGVQVFGRSFKYHRPRGVIAAGSEEPNALVAVIRDEARCAPNLRATQVELYDGLVARSQNRWPSLDFDVQAINDLMSPLLPAAFYYKTFMWPRAAWHRLYEPFIRRAAGLGESPTLPDPDRYSQRFAHCDVLVVGSGPAGIAAALTASASGARVMLCDEQPEFGGSLLDEPTASVDGAPAADWIRDSIATLRARANVKLLTRTTAFGYFPHNLIGLNERITEHLATPSADMPRERLWQVRAARVVLATGSIERPLVFPGNDRPGVMLASAARTYLNRYGVAVGQDIVLVTGSDAAYSAALDLRGAGMRVALIADVRTDAAGAPLDIVRQAGIEVVTGATVLGTRGRLGVREVTIGLLARGAVNDTRRVNCDALLVSGGYTPSVHLFSQSRGKLEFNEARQAFLPSISAEPESSAGSCRGIDGYAQVLTDGARVGAKSALAAGHSVAAQEYRVQAREFSMNGLPGVLPQANHLQPSRAFVDFQNDVTTKDLALAMREGFESVEHIKRYTTTGMATDQGKTSNMNALAIRRGRTRPDRSPRWVSRRSACPTRRSRSASLRGMTVAICSIRSARRRCTTGRCSRAPCSRMSANGSGRGISRVPGKDMHAAVDRECRTVRAGVGMFDASTLGKIEVVGPDAATFLSRMYVNGFATLAVAAPGTASCCATTVSFTTTA